MEQVIGIAILGIIALFLLVCVWGMVTGAIEEARQMRCAKHKQILANINRLERELHLGEEWNVEIELDRQEEMYQQKRMNDVFRYMSPQMEKDYLHSLMLRNAIADDMARDLRSLEQDARVAWEKTVREITERQRRSTVFKDI